MIESTLLRTQGKNVSLFEQELFDCSVNWGTNVGCSGGNIMYTLSWLNRNGQVNSSVYPQNPNSYNNGANGTCNTATTNTTTSGLQSVEPSSFFYFGPMGGFGLANFSHGTYEQNLVVHINTYGLASQILWVPWDFQYYLDGIWDPSVSDCQSAIGLHSLVLTGYGTGNESSNLYYDPNQVVYPTKDYWVAKNSFGTGWGMNGYIYIVRNSNNSCTQNFGYGNWSNYLVPTVKTFNGL
uniref:Peptidase C1A papain C-terminal domain-containing protein n=1 Tax=Acrobeloides nanus TaxID=290746 RepID=A0A914EAF3_9BILA